MGPDYPVYVVDDDPDIRDWAAIACEEVGIRCRTFEGGAEFLAEADRLEPGCILLDIRMPKPNGLAVQTELARRGSAMPIIVMTGFGDVEVAVQSMKLGALDFLEKPFGSEVLMEAIGRGFDRLEADCER